MEQKIAELTEKIYKEGVEKGNEEKKAIIDAAQSEAASIKTEAQKEADTIVAQAQTKAAEIQKNAESEMKLASQQAISAVKQKITDLILSQIGDEGISATLSDPEVIKELLSTLVKNWSANSQEAPSLEVLLPEALAEKLDKSLKSSLKKILNDGVTVTFSKAIKGGFQIGPKDGTFKISMSDEDFNEFFKDYLRPKTRTFLFDE